jgi:hypothetical protein
VLPIFIPLSFKDNKKKVKKQVLVAGTYKLIRNNIEK